MFDQDKKPIVVVVSEDRWDAFVTHLVPTPRDEWLLSLIHKQGGISDTVAPGRYHFNARRRGLFKVELDLKKVGD